MAKIAEIQTIPIRLPMHGSLSWGKSSRLDVLEHVLVRLITDTGHEGWAEAPPRPTIYGETPESIQVIIRDHFAPALIGWEIEDIAGINQQMATIANNHAAKGAIDIALHEALAATKDQTLLDFIDPPQRKIKVSYILGISDRETMLEEVKSVYDQGVRVFKVKVGRDFADDLARIRELQAEFAGSGVSLYADANECLSLVKAPKQLQQLADHDLLYVEEPLPIEQIKRRVALRQAEILPLIGDDSCFTPRDLARELAFDTFDILNIKTARTGYHLSRQMLTAAQTKGKGAMVGSQASSILGTIRAAIFAGSEGIYHPSELSFFLKVADDIVQRPIQIIEGYIHLETLATITIDEKRLGKFIVEPPP